MNIPPGALGFEMADVVEKATVRRSQAYAASIMAGRECYLNDARSECMIAPPAFCVVPEWAVLNSASFRKATNSEGNAAWRAIHVHQDSSFHRAIRPPEILRIKAQIIGVKLTSVGALVEVTVQTYNADSEEKIVDTLWTAIFRGMGVEREGICEVRPPMARPEVADNSYSKRTINVPRWMAHTYTECSGIWNPIHTERRIAEEVGLPDIILHGTATWALTGETLIDVYAEGDPTQLRRLSCRFRAPVIPGTSVTLYHAKSLETNNRAVLFHASTKQGAAVLSDGIAIFSDGVRTQ